MFVGFNEFHDFEQGTIPALSLPNLLLRPLSPPLMTMKIATLLLSLTIATSGSAFVMAAECTADELLSLTSTLSNVTTKCPDLTSSSDLNAVCSDSTCLKAISDVVGDLPDCTVSGSNTKQSLQTAVDGCGSSKTGAASSIDVAFTSAAIAASIVFAVAL